MNNEATQIAWEKIKLAIDKLPVDTIYKLAEWLEQEAGERETDELNREEDAGLTRQQLNRKYGEDAPRD